MEVSYQRHAPVAFTTAERPPNSLNQRLGGPKKLSRCDGWYRISWPTPCWKCNTGFL